jgi:hypothetical protein
MALAVLLAVPSGCADVLGIRVFDDPIGQGEHFNNPETDPDSALPPAETPPAFERDAGADAALPDRAEPDPGPPPGDAPPVIQRTLFGAYRFARGPASHDVGAEYGLLAGAADLALVSTTLATERGGRLELATDGSFRFWPATQTFWGDDYVEYVETSFRIRARLSVLPGEELDLADVRSGGGNGFVIDGSADLGRSVARGGDVNGDGREDILIGKAALVGHEATGCVLPCHGSAGDAFVAFGRMDSTPLPSGELATSLERGFLISGLGEDVPDSLGYSVAGAGDTDGDGLDDLIIGAPFVQGVGYGDNGGAFLVFGAPQPGSVPAAELVAGTCPPARPPRGLFYSGRGLGTLIGSSVSSAGDANGDGFADVLIGAGAMQVVFGGARDCADVAAPLSTRRGYRILGVDTSAAPNTNGLCRATAAAGDVNGDGLDDIIIGADLADRASSDDGIAYVIFGKTDTRDVSLGALGDDGIVITAPSSGSRTGQHVASAGDVNGDGYGDVLISANTPAGRAGYVIFGRPAAGSVSLAALETNSTGGFMLRPNAANAVASLAGAGDLDGDGLDDVLVGGRPDELGVGRAYLVFGKTTGDPVSLASVRADRELGFSVRGQANDALGYAVSGADVNADGLSDLILGAPSDGSIGVGGRAYVLFGWDARNVLGRRERGLIGGPGRDDFVLSDDSVIRVAGGNGFDTMHLRGNGRAIDLRVRSLRIDSVEQIDLTGDGPQTLLLDDAVVRRLPRPHGGVPPGLAKTLVVTGDAEDTVRFEGTDYEPAPDHLGRQVYRRIGAHYGIEVSGVTVVQGAARRVPPS